MNQLAANAITYALASLWLGAWVIIAVTLLLRALPGLEARWRYRVWLMALGISLIGPGLLTRMNRAEPTGSLDLPSTAEESAPDGRTAGELVVTQSTRNRFSPPVTPSARAVTGKSPVVVKAQSGPAGLELPDQALRSIGWVLLAGAVLALLRIPLQLRALGRLKRRAEYAPEELRRLWDATIDRLPCRRGLRLRVSDDVMLPVACGYLQPAVVVPRGLSELLSDEETSYLLLHERAHLVRRDDWGLLFERTIGALCWWHPAVWWMGKQLEQEREEACDQLVACGNERRRYARTLVHLAEIAQARPGGLAPGALRGELTRRVEALLAGPASRQASLWLRAPAALLAGGILLTAARFSPPGVIVIPGPIDSLTPAPKSQSIPVASLDSIFRNYADSGFSGTILLAQRGRILLEKGYGLADREKGIPATPETRYSTAGMTKLFTAAAVLDLAEQGKLSLQDSVGHWFPALTGTKGAVTLDQLLTYRDGLTRLNAPVQRDDPDEFVAALARSPASFTPGAGYRYSDHGHSLLGLVIEQVTGEAYEGYIRSRFLDPAGLSHTGFEDEDGPTAVEYSGPANALEPIGRRAYRWGRRASLGMVSTAGDLYRWFHQLTDSNAVTPWVRQQIFQVRSRTDYKSDQAYGLELVDRGQGHRLWRRVAGTPGFEGELIYDPDNDWTAVILVNTRLGWRFRVWSQIERAMWANTSPDHAT